MNAEDIKTLTKMFIREIGLYYPERIEEMKAVKKSIGVKKFKIEEYEPFVAWYGMTYTISANDGKLVYEDYGLSLEAATKLYGEQLATGKFVNIKLINRNRITDKKEVIIEYNK